MSAITAADVRRDDEGYWFQADGPDVAGLGPAELNAEPERVPDTEAAAALFTRCVEVITVALPVALEGVLADSQSIRQEEWFADAYGDEADELLPKMDDTATLLQHLSDPVIFCSEDPQGSGELCIGFGFGCTWDEEHGTCGVVTVNGPDVRLYEAGGPMASYTPYG